MTTQCYVWDITVKADATDTPTLISLFKDHCKKWCFQLEKGHETGYLHYQCRVSLMVKKRRSEIIELFGISGSHYSETSNTNKSNTFYCMKEDTRIEGPWTDKTESSDVYVPSNFKLNEFLPWQETLVKLLDEKPGRHIDVLYDPDGCKGKSTITSFLHLHKKGILVPAVNDSDKIIPMVCNILMAMKMRNPKGIFIDLPRSMNQEKLGGMYHAIEVIKGQRVYDFRYAYKEWWFEPTAVWVMCNTLPDPKYLTKDRWRVWEITETNELRKVTTKGIWGA